MSNFIVFNLETKRKYEPTVRPIETEKGAKTLVTKLTKKTSQAHTYFTREEWINRPVEMKVVRNLMSGAEIEIPVDTPFCCDPSTETYWSM